MGDSNPMIPAGARVGRVALSVADLDRLTEFYREVVGLSIRERSERAATLGAGGTPLLSLLADSDAAPRAPDETGLFHTAFLLPSRAALGDALGRIREHWTLDGASDHLVSEALYLSDPEGNGVEIYRDRSQEEWPIEGDRVGIDTLPLDLSEIAALGTGSETAPVETTVGHVHLEVSSLPRARAFYVECLGLRVRQTYADSALFLAAGDYHHHIGLNTWNGRSTPANGRGLAWFELVVSGELPTIRERLTERGIEAATEDDALVLTDSDGISLRLRVGSS